LLEGRGRPLGGEAPLIQGVSDLKEGSCFQGDEASPMSPAHKLEVSGKAGGPVEVQAAAQAPSLPHWYALYTRSHCEQLVAHQLAAKGFQIFLPTLET
jgi:hypothetical protein